MDLIFSAIRTAPFLFILILFIVVFTHLRNKSGKLSEKREKEFWERELAANATRKKDISNLPYIKVPVDTLFPVDPAAILADPAFMSAANDVALLRDAPILNLNGKSNTDLKLEYGAANINILSEADNNYTILIAALNRLGILCHENGLEEDARRFLEYCIEIGGDTAAAYVALCEIYKSELSASDAAAHIAELKTKAEALSSIRRDAIIEKISTFQNE